MIKLLPCNIEVEEKEVRNLLCCAFEGGSNYWLKSVSYHYAPGLSSKDFKKGGKHSAEDYNPLYLVVPFVEGCAVVCLDDDGDTKQEHLLTREKIIAGLDMMANLYPKHFGDFRTGNADASTGDVFIQLCLFRNIVFC